MPYHDPYEAWKHARARALVSLDFADRVLAAVQERPMPWQSWLAHLLRSPVVRIALASLACAACLLRVLQVVALFLVGQPSM